jgi:hypothetical protein
MIGYVKWTATTDLIAQLLGEMELVVMENRPGCGAPKLRAAIPTVRTMLNAMQQHKRQQATEAGTAAIALL